MSEPQFFDIPIIEGIFNSYSATNTNKPLTYKIPATYLQNLSSGSMIIDSCSNIILQARNKHVRVNNKMGIGMDPSSAYSLHVSGDTCISGNITSNNFTDLSSKYYSLLSSVNELSNNNYTLNTTITTISNSLYNILSNIIFGTGYYGTITFINNSIYDISFRVSWYPSYLSQEQEYTPNYSSVNSIDGSTNVIISNTNRLASPNSNFFLNIKSNYNSFVNESFSGYEFINFNNSIVTIISSEFFDNDNKHRITINVSNDDDIENIPITFNYNPLYKGFFGTFALGNKTPGSIFDYSYNYLSISGSNVNSGLLTLSGQVLSNNSISSVNRVASQNTPLNLSLLIYNGYDISINALPSSIIGISNNILTNYSKTFATSNILYSYNIIPLSSVLLGGTIGLSFEMYKTGFFGSIIVNNILDYTIRYNYTYLSISGDNTSYSNVINSTSSNTSTISGELRLSYETSEITMNIRTSYLVEDISYTISGGTLTSNSQNLTINEDTLVQALSRTSTTSAVAMSLSGDVIVIGASTESATISGTTYVERGNVYIWIRNPVRIGTYSSSTIPINISLANVNIGSSVAVSGNGNIIVIGSLGLRAILVYDRNMTSTVFSSNTQPISRAVVSTNVDGSIIGVGYPTAYSNHGSVILYSNNGTSLTEIYTYLSTSEYVQVGVSIAVSSDGRVVVVSGARYLEGVKGVLLIFKNNASLGSMPNYQVLRILGLFYVDIYDSLDVNINISINSDATRVAVGYPYFITNFTANVGRVFIFELNSNNNFSTIGASTLYDPSPVINHKFGYAVTLNSDGSTLIVSQYGSQNIKVYSYDNTNSQFTLTNTKSYIEASYLVCSQTDIGLLYVATLTNESFNHVRNFGSYRKLTYTILPNDNNLVNGIIQLSNVIVIQPPTAVISATSVNIAPGTSTTITPLFTNATEVTINDITTTPSGGQIITNTPFSSGTLNQNTTFILVVTNINGLTATASVTINVIQPPSVSIEATSVTIASGTSTTLTPIFSGTIVSKTINGVSTTPDGGQIISNTPFSSGILNQTTTFILVVTNIVDVSATASVTISVIPNPTALIWATQTTIASGDSTTLNFQFTNATSVTLTKNSTPTGQSITNGGALNVSPSVGSTIYTLVATNSLNISVQSSVTINVVSGWWGNIYMELVSTRGTGIDTAYNYTIYKGATTQSVALVTNRSISSSTRDLVVASSAHTLYPVDATSTFLVVINSVYNGDFFLDDTQNVMTIGNNHPSYSVTPIANGTDVRIRFTINPP